MIEYKIDLHVYKTFFVFNVNILINKDTFHDFLFLSICQFILLLTPRM